MKVINLTKGYEAKVDDCDYEYLNRFHWSYSNGYAVRSKKVGDKLTTISMHRELAGEPNMLVDHADRDKLNNTRGNLRIATASENQSNRRKQHNNTSGHKGVYFHKLLNKWYSAISVQGKLKSLGYFKKKEDAIAAYNEAAVQYKGDFAFNGG